MDWNRINDLVTEIRALYDGTLSTEFITSPASEETIRAVEKSLKMSFPPSYREFLCSFGMIYCAGCAVSGIHDDDANETGGGSIIGDTHRMREEHSLPEHLLVVSSDEEAPFCIDMSSANPEPPIVLYQVNTRSTHPLDDGFESYLVGRFLPMLRDMIEA